jgi:18S rRNA (adenine1779-N6/adenine1780-N6)-dimethyltransferase
MPAVRNNKSNAKNRSSPYGGTLGGMGSSLPTLKKHGQHLLKNPGIIDKIVAACDLKPTDHVFEIGPGTGALTMRMLEQAKKVVAYEIDPRMAAEVRKRAQQAGRQNLEVTDGDVLRADWPVFDVCATNLPYQISSPFTFRLIAHRPMFRCAVVMFQKEFAERLIAKVGESQYGRLALNTSLFVNVSCVCKVAKGSFTPPPEVDSMVVKFVPRQPPIEVDFKEWDGLMRICFLRKRKILRANFCNKSTLQVLEENYKTWCALNDQKPSPEPMKERVTKVLQQLKLEEQRAIKIDLDIFFRLLLEFNRAGIHFSNATGKIAKKPGDAVEIDDSFFDDAGMDDDGED